MKISPIQFNFIQPKPQKTDSSPLRMNNGIQRDAVSFSGNCNEFFGADKLEKLEPKHKGVIYKKVRDENGNLIKKVPVEVSIVKEAPDQFYFYDEKRPVGYIEMSYITKDHCKEEKDTLLYKNYKEQGIIDDRIVVDMIKNFAPKEYGGIGHLADLLEVACCKELGIEPNVVSESAVEAAPLHYLRGKRFIPYESYCSDRKMAQYKLHDKNPNVTVKEIVERTTKGEKFDTSDLPFMPLSYMPKEMIQNLEKELEEYPIF